MSYSTDLKKSLKEMSMKKKCCRKAFFYGERFAQSSIAEKCSADFENDNMNNDVSVNNADIDYEFFKCASCKSSFLRGVFCVCGTVSDPSKSFHFEIKLNDKTVCDLLDDFIRKNCTEMKQTMRKGKFSLYLKKADDIQDILHFMGASKEAFEIANEKIKRELLNLANRRNNFDYVNIQKTVSASQETVDAINVLIKKGKLTSLPTPLAETARLRLDNPYANLEELAALHSSRITKSGVNHRLKKLIELANDD